MTEFRKYIIPFFLLLLFCSCAYHMTSYELNGKKYKTRVYKDSEKRLQYVTKQNEKAKQLALKNEKEWYESEFNQLDTKSVYQKYAGNITNGTKPNAIYIQFDTIRIYLKDEAIKYKTMFTSGLLSSQLLYCKIDTLCQPPLYIKTNNPEAENPENVYGDWKGLTISISEFKELNYLKNKPTQRKFKFWINGNGWNNVFLLELTNGDANLQTDLETYIRGAKITFLKDVGGMG